jgi:hypothetical protein
MDLLWHEARFEEEDIENIPKEPLQKSTIR